MTRHRISWIILLVLGIGTLWIGVGDFVRRGDGDPALMEMMTGVPWDEMKSASPREALLADLLSAILGAWLIGFALLAIAIAATAYRWGQRWAWLALWSVPLAYLLVLTAVGTANRVPNTPTPPALFSAPIAIVLSVLALLLDIRAFFPRRTSLDAES